MMRLVGPEAMSRGLSPGTSEISSETSFAGAQSAPSLPPLSDDRCRRTQLISEIVAPLANSAAPTACLSPRVRPGKGAASKEEIVGRKLSDLYKLRDPTTGAETQSALKTTLKAEIDPAAWATLPSSSLAGGFITREEVETILRLIEIVV